MSSVTLYVPKRTHSLLIGAGGSVIKGLQSTHQVKIFIPSPMDNSSAVRISGPPAGLKTAETAIEGILGFAVGAEPLETRYLDIPTRDHGAIVGRGGSGISALEKEFSCDVYVPRRGDAADDVIVEGPSKRLDALQAKLKSMLGYDIKLGKPTTAGAAGGDGGAAGSVPRLDLSAMDINEALFFPDVDDDGFEFNRFLAYLNSARRTLSIAIYTLSDNGVSDVIAAAHARGVAVRIIADSVCMENEGSDIQGLHGKGIPVRVDKKKATEHFHHKFAVIDDTLLINGSYNWTSSARRINWENVVITNNKGIVASFAANFETMWANDRFRSL